MEESTPGQPVELLCGLPWDQGANKRQRQLQGRRRNRAFQHQSDEVKNWKSLFGRHCHWSPTVLPMVGPIAPFLSLTFCCPYYRSFNRSVLVSLKAWFLLVLSCIIFHSRCIY
ncbi:hypothetical protein SUGI_0265250 [Cryptomeria japonica]|nr:hypothetical protein SUGI_0265250 [Cryptomeria japonica]